MVKIPTKWLNFSCSSRGPCIYEVSLNEIITGDYPNLVMLSTIHMKNEVDPTQAPTVLENLSTVWIKVDTNALLVCYAIIELTAIGLTSHHGANYKITTKHDQAYNRHPWISTNQQQPITGWESQTCYPNLQLWNQTSYPSMQSTDKLSQHAQQITLYIRAQRVDKQE